VTCLPGSKGYLWERGLHAPLVDFPVGWRVEGFVSFIDFGATLLNLAGVKVPSGMDGRPLLGEGITGAEVDARDVTFDLPRGKIVGDRPNVTTGLQGGFVRMVAPESTVCPLRGDRHLGRWGG